jgi:Zn-dependent peptidase ImmA (M78 family)
MRASVRNSALRAGELALEMDTWINRRFELPKADLPDLYNYSSVAAAEAIRNAWGLGEKPIRNMVSTLEAKGIRVYSLAEDTQDMDAYSFWASDQPFIFLNTKKTVERSRFDAAHELGHLILHKHGEPMGKEIEAQANSFASALLMPEGSVKSHAIHYPSLKDIITLKSFWLVSASSLVRRLKDLNLITEWQYRSLTIDLSRNGYMKNEPEPICTREESKLLPMVFSALKEEGISKGDVAKELGIPIEDINALTFKTQLTSIPGKNSKPASINSKNDYLKVIK